MSEPSSSPAPAANAAPAATAALPLPRRRAIVAVLVLVLLAGIAWGAYHLAVLADYESTDNAYVQGHVVPLTAQQAGTVTAVAVEENERVAAGQRLLSLDSADARVALDLARAALAEAVRAQRVIYADSAALAAVVAQRQAEIDRVRTEIERAQADLDRRAPLEAGGAVSREEVAHARARLAELRQSLQVADGAARAAREQQAAQGQQIEGLPLAEQPAVMRAAARLREAWLALARCEVAAPLAATVARRSVQPGQRVAAGAPLMTLVALDSLWVDANYKEGQLARIKPGQRARLTADVFGRKVVYDGTVVAFGAGTGAAFALLPAQNATGNWIKIVQRVPVRIALDPAQAKTHPLRLGLSMTVRIDVTQPPAAAAAALPRVSESAAAAAVERAQEDAERDIRRIVAAHSAKAVSRAGPAAAGRAGSRR